MISNYGHSHHYRRCFQPNVFQFQNNIQNVFQPLAFGQAQASPPANSGGGSGDFASMLPMLLLMKLLGRKSPPAVNQSSPTVIQQAPQVVQQVPQTVTQTVTQAQEAPPAVNPQIRPQGPDGPRIGTYMNTAQWWFNHYNGGRAELSLDTFAAVSGRYGGGWAIAGNAGLLFKDADRDADGKLTVYEFAKGCERGDMNGDGRNDTADAMGYAEKLRADGTAKLLGVI